MSSAAVIEKPKRKPDIRHLAMTLYDYVEQNDEDWVEWYKHEIETYYGEAVLDEVMAEIERITPAMFKSACRKAQRL